MVRNGEDILQRSIDANVFSIKALGGGWSVTKKRVSEIPLSASLLALTFFLFVVLMDAPGWDTICGIGLV
jgi:hypothetical protein